MKITNALLSVVALLLVALLARSFVASRSVRWEYRTVETHDTIGKSLHEGIDAAGRDGWELVSVANDASGKPRYFLKRPLR